MAGQKCIIFRGSRLTGASVGLFDGPPLDLTKTAYHHGVPDVCHKLHFPPPHDMQLLIPGGDIIAEIPFTNFVGFYYNIYYNNRPPYAVTEKEAFDAMMSRPPDYGEYPLSNFFALIYTWFVLEIEPNDWLASGQVNMQYMRIPLYFLNPEWLTDDSVSFSLAFSIPNLPGVPDWCRLNFLDNSIPFFPGEFETSVVKSLYYNPSYKVLFTCGPVPFSFERYQELPYIEGLYTRGFYFSDLIAFNLRLIVRRGGDEFKVCWPESVYNAAQYAAVVDTQSGLVVGPAIKIS